MPSIDLNIIDRGTPGSEWTAKNTGIQASQLDKVKENKTDNSNALNSLPTPFALFRGKRGFPSCYGRKA